MSTRRLTEAERRAIEKKREDFLTTREPPRKWKKHEREEAQRQYRLEREAMAEEIKKLRPLSELDCEEGWTPVGGSWSSIDPVTAFMGRRLQELILRYGKGVIPQALRQVRVDLLASDVPLSSDMRRTLADELAAAYWPDPKRANKRLLLEARSYQDFLKYYVGMTAMDAEDAAAKFVGLSVDALRQRRKRARKRGQRLRQAADIFGTFF